MKRPAVTVDLPADHGGAMLYIVAPSESRIARAARLFAAARVHDAGDLLSPAHLGSAASCRRGNCLTAGIGDRAMRCRKTRQAPSELGLDGTGFHPPAGSWLQAAWSSRAAEAEAATTVVAARGAGGVAVDPARRGGSGGGGGGDDVLPGVDDAEPPICALRTPNAKSNTATSTLADSFRTAAAWRDFHRENQVRGRRHHASAAMRQRA